MEQFLLGNVPLMHLLNANFEYDFQQTSAIKEVNDWDLSRPWTLSFKAFHCSIVGQQGSSGKHRCGASEEHFGALDFVVDFTKTLGKIQINNIAHENIKDVWTFIIADIIIHTNHYCWPHQNILLSKFFLYKCHFSTKS